MNYFLGILWLLVLPCYAQTTIEVFADRHVKTQEIPNTHIIFYDLSQLKKVQAQSPHFPPNPTESEKLARDWLASPSGKAYIERLKNAYEGHGKMHGYGLLKIPAIVFEKGKYVVYGTTDLSIAVRDFDSYVKAERTRAANNNGEGQ